MSDLQRLTDRIGEVLSRSVAIDDPQMRLLSYSPHYGVVDEQRLASILHRKANPEAIAWARRFGVHRATKPVRLAGEPDSGMMSRLCVPIRYHDRHLGFLWIIDPDELLDESQIAVAEASADEAADILFRDGLVSDLERAREKEALRDLIDPDASVRSDALVRLAEDGLLDAGGPVSVLVLDTVPSPTRAGRTARAESAIAEVRRALPAKHSLGLVRPDHAILLVVHDRDLAATTWGQRLLTAFGAEQRGTALPLRVGLGTTVPMLEDAHISYRQALQAVKIGRVLDVDDVVEWSQLGIYRLLAQLGHDAVGLEALHPALRKLLEYDPSGQLVLTLETFLDLAGDIKATSEALFIHRTTLYHRLAKVELRADVNLRKGLDRLDLHLALKLGHLSGHLPASPDAAGESPVHSG